MNRSENGAALVVAAHPDDEVLGCGGTIARLAYEGHDVYIAILGEGITSRSQRRDEADFIEVEALRECSHRVAELLGARELFLFDLPDNRFDTMPMLDIVKIIEGVLEKVSPEIVYTQHGGDLNIDHTIVHRATLTATRPIGQCPVKEIYAYEVSSSTEWAFGQFQPVFRPNVFVDISSVLDTKCRALELYQGEARTYPHPRSSEALRAVSRRWGSMVGYDAAEAFELIRSAR